jgi:hypothetical protein
MRRTYANVLLFCILSATACPADAGPWSRKQGSGFVQLGFSTIGYNKSYGDDSNKHILGAQVRDNVLQVFVEYGLPAGFSVTTMVPFKFLSVTPDVPGAVRVSNSGPGDIDLTVRRTWLQEAGFALATELLFGVPVGSRSDANGLFLGDGEFNVSPRCVAGKSFYPVPLYMTADLGFNFRTNNFSHDVPYGFELGYGFLDSRLYLILQISGRESISNNPTLPFGSTAAEVTANALGLHGHNMEYLAIIAKLYFKATEGIGISLSYATAAHGRNVAGGIVLAGGVLCEF